PCRSSSTLFPYTTLFRSRWWKTFEPDYNAIVTEVARTSGVPSIDIYSHFKDKPELFADEAHFTEAGHRQMAQFIYDNVASVLSRSEEHTSELQSLAYLVC